LIPQKLTIFGRGHNWQEKEMDPKKVAILEGNIIGMKRKSDRPKGGT
jgi:hypothetical protein